jgi:hypothetical protein
MSMLTLSDAASNSFEQHRAGGGDAAKVVDGDDVQPESGFALVVNGHSLVYALAEEMEMLFLSVAERCNGECIKKASKHRSDTVHVCSSCDMLSGDAPAEGHGGGAGQEVQEGGHAGHRRRRQRRVNDQE